MLLSLAGCSSIPWVETDRPNCAVDLFFPVKYERVTWSGECNKGKVDGLGKLASSSGTRLEGTFRAGIAYDAQGRISAPRPDGQRVLIGATFKQGRGDFYHLTKDADGFQAYARRLAQTFRRNIIFNDKPTPPAPKVVVEVETEPDGKVKSVRVQEPSISPSWDTAVILAISKVAYLPSDEDGIVPPRLVLIFRPY
jgi:TonB family protein